jgi:hypothetical protein
MVHIFPVYKIEYFAVVLYWRWLQCMINGQASLHVISHPWKLMYNRFCAYSSNFGVILSKNVNMYADHTTSNRWFFVKLCEVENWGWNACRDGSWYFLIYSCFVNFNWKERKSTHFIEVIRCIR